MTDDPRARMRAAWTAARKRLDPADLKAIEALLEKAHEEAHQHAQGEAPTRGAPAEMALVLSSIRTELREPGAALDVPLVLPDGTIMGSEQYEQLDPGWLGAVVDWLHHPRDRYVPFRTGAIPQPIPDDFVLGLVGDWGTGSFPNGQAEAVGRELARAEPDISIHLGDVYYSGTSETERAHLIEDFPAGRIASYALNSNHEMYAGGTGYFEALLDSAAAFASQGACSYFALENASWVVVGLDSAYFASWVEMGMSGALCEVQTKFLAEQAAKGKNLLILTHHPGLRADGTPIEPYYTQVTSALDASKRNVWYWGHDHAGYVHRKRGSVECRCIGHGSLPYGLPTDLESSASIEWFEQEPAEPFPRLRNGFAVLRFSGERLSEEILDSAGRCGWSR